MHTRPERLSESCSQRIERLYKSDFERKKATQDAIREEHYGKYKFKPKINRISKLLGCSTGGFEELYKNERGKRAKEAVRKAVEEERASDCTFEPRLNTSSSTVGYKPVNHLDATTVLDSIDGMRRDKEEKLEQMRMEAEHEKMKECTFEPTIVSKAVVRSSNPVIVRGLGRFLETREHAKALKRRRQSASEAHFLSKIFTASVA